MSPQSLTRRQVLSLGCLSVASLAGCASRATPPEDTPPAQTDTPTFTKAIAIEERDLVVTLPDGHSIEELTLVDPDGQHFATRPVQTGVTQVRFELLDPRLWGADYAHYEPGVYELVGVSEERTEKQEIPLEPDIRIADVEQVRDEQLPKRYIGIAVTVENVGTGPTWVYDMSYSGAPFSRADSDITNGIGNPIFSYPERSNITAIGPGEEDIFIGSRRPLLFTQESDCWNTAHEMTIHLGIATGEVIQQKIRLIVSGAGVEDDLSRQWVCDSIDVEVINGG